MPWIILIVAVLVAFLAGFLAARAANGPARRRERELDDELQRSRSELAAYREQVSRHFSRTAELVNEMTANYRAVYRHLAVGSKELCDASGPRLESLGDDKAQANPEPPPPALAGAEQASDSGWYDAPPTGEVVDFSKEDRVH